MVKSMNCFPLNIPTFAGLFDSQHEPETGEEKP
jgi:hypothetical protein